MLATGEHFTTVNHSSTTSYPVVVHLDLDCLLLKPLDDLFDLMLDPSFDRAKIDAMWLEPGDFPEQVDFLFTRDYNMVE